MSSSVITSPNLGAATQTQSGLVSTGTQTFGGDKNFAGAVSSNSYALNSAALNTQTTSYTLQASDNGKVVVMNSSTAVNLTVPAGLALGFNCSVIQIGTGQVTLVASSVTLNSSSGLKIAAQHGAVSLLSYSSNVFNVSGNTVA